VIGLALLGAGIGAGAWLVVRALAPRLVPLARIASTLSRPGVPATHRPPVRTPGDRAAALAARVLPALGDRADRSQLLGLTGRSAERLALDKLTGAAAGLVGTALVGVGLTLTAAAPPPGVLAVAALLVAAGGFVLPDLLLRDEAERRRRAFRHALSSYLDLVNVILAGGGGIETSLHAAAEAGDGWAFAAIRRALDRARLTNRSPWDTFAELGADLGIEELAELAASVELAGSQGARIRASLAAKADSLRGHQVAETEAAAEAATERMTIPVAVLLFGFLVFIAYPAVQQITTVSNPVP
jgi:Flp pilus assembly protein TadB